MPYLPCFQSVQGKPLQTWSIAPSKVSDCRNPEDIFELHLSPASMDHRTCQAVSTFDRPTYQSTKQVLRVSFAVQLQSSLSFSGFGQRARTRGAQLVHCSSQIGQFGLEHIWKQLDYVCFWETPQCYMFLKLEILDRIFSVSITSV